MVQYGKFLRWSGIGHICHMEQMQFAKNIIHYNTRPWLMCTMS